MRPVAGIAAIALALGTAQGRGAAAASQSNLPGLGQFLQEWAANICKTFKPDLKDMACKPEYKIRYKNGAILRVVPVNACGTDMETTFRAALEAAPPPPMPPGLADKTIALRFSYTCASGNKLATAPPAR